MPGTTNLLLVSRSCGFSWQRPKFGPMSAYLETLVITLMQGRSIKQVVGSDLIANTSEMSLSWVLLRWDSRFPCDSQEVFGQVSTLTKTYANDKSVQFTPRAESLVGTLHDLFMLVVCETKRCASKKPEEALRGIPMDDIRKLLLEAADDFLKLSPPSAAQTKMAGAKQRTGLILKSQHIHLLSYHRD